MTSADTTKRKRAKYSRPCDACAFRRVRCDRHDGTGRTSCSNCVHHEIPCTNNRIRRKSGPKRLHQKTREKLNDIVLGGFEKPLEVPAIQNVPEEETVTALISVECLIPYLQIYQTWYYGIWPVLSVAFMVDKLMGKLRWSGDSSVQTFIRLDKDNYLTYCTACSVAAAMLVQVSFFTTNALLANVSHSRDPKDYVNESKRVRRLFDYDEDPLAETLLLSFFLYLYYVNTKNGKSQAVLFLREAIAMGHLLGLHDNDTYLNKSPAEVHRLRKIYYSLIISERFMAFEEHIPIVLEPSIPFPSLEDEEYPGLLEGFTELIRIFSTPDQKFFQAINIISIKQGDSKMVVLRDFLQYHSKSFQKEWIMGLQDKFDNIPPVKKVSDTQRLNIVLTQAWFKALAWHLTNEHDLITHSTDEHDCLSVAHPLKIARDFLGKSDNLPPFAYESNGPGAALKVLEIANSLLISLQTRRVAHGLDYLKALFDVVTFMKNDDCLPEKLYSHIGHYLGAESTRSIPPVIEELDEDDDDLAVQAVSPFTQISMAFGMDEPYGLLSTDLDFQHAQFAM